MSAVANQEGPVKAQASRQNTMDLLDELPDIGNGFFSFPVDDFFGNYVEELGQRGMQGALPETGANPAIGTIPQGANASFNKLLMPVCP